MTCPREIFANVDPRTQTAADVEGWITLAKGSGLAIILLVVIGGALLKLVRWFRPKADELAEILLANIREVPKQLEIAQRQNEAVLAALHAQNLLLQQISERMSNNADRAQLVATNVSAMSEKLVEVIERLPRKED